VVDPDGAFSIDAAGPSLLWTLRENLADFPDVPTISYTTGHVTVEVAASGRRPRIPSRGAHARPTCARCWRPDRASVRIALADEDAPGRCGEPCAPVEWLGESASLLTGVKEVLALFVIVTSKRVSLYPLLAHT
jgi:hypothetical protein